MISYCPLDLPEKQSFQSQSISPTFSKPTSYMKNTQKTLENTECNYLVMFFVAGVFILTVTDQFKK